ncbi:MAG TPA: GNAT family N-acetyltransferase [Gammaproteobacteria bacterium]|nr:GNAT family N-acetyltransferase [Gammaproteobacteria bacterium]
MSETLPIQLRQATSGDLPAINRVIDAAVMGWKLPERVKRLALPSYRYDALDLDHLEIHVVEDGAGEITGVVACEPANPADIPTGMTGLLLHGLYVHPRRQRQGLGRRLLQVAEERARHGGYDGLLVKAQPDARGFFEARGMIRLDSRDPSRDYQYRYWKPVREQV